jgi:hypothetical protein
MRWRRASRFRLPGASVGRYLCTEAARLALPLRSGPPLRWADRRESPTVFVGAGANLLWEVVMRTALYVCSETLTALVNMGSFAVLIGALAAVYSQSVRTGFLVASFTFIATSLGFAYSVWRFHRPRSPA